MKNLITGLDFQLYKVTQGQRKSSIIFSHVLLLQGLLGPSCGHTSRVCTEFWSPCLQQLRLQRHIGPQHPPQNLFPQYRRALMERGPSAAVTRRHVCSGYQQQWDHLLTTRTENKRLNFNTTAHTYLSGVFTTGGDERCRPSLFLSDLVITSDGELQFFRPLRQDAFILFLLLYSQHLNTPFPLALHDLKPSLSELNNMEKKSESFSPKWFKHAQWLINYPVFTQHSTSLLLQSDYRAAGRLNRLVVLEQRG